MKKSGVRLNVAVALVVALLSGFGAGPAMAVQQVSSPTSAKPSPSPTPQKQSSAAAKAAATKAAAAKAAAKAAAAKAAAAKAAAAKAAAQAAAAKAKASTPKPTPTPTPTPSKAPALAAPAFTLTNAAETVQATKSLIGFTVKSTGGAIATFSISPAAPAGTVFNTTTGALSGTPTTALTGTLFTVTATNATGFSTATYSLTVTPALLAPAFTLSRSSESGQVNRALFGFTVYSTGGAIASFSISPTPPAGITFNTTTGALSGTPTATSPNILFSITATNATGSSSAVFIMDVRPGLQAPAFTLSRSSESVQVSNTIQGFTINSTGGDIATFSISPISPPGTVFNPFTGALTGTPTSVQAATTYTITATNAAGSSTASFSLGVTTPLLAAPQFSLSLGTESVQVGSALIGFTINSSGGAISSFSISPAAPAGTTFNTTTGQLTGTPTSPLSATDFVITATNSTGSAPRLYNLTVLALPKLALTRAPSGPVSGQAFRVQPQITIQDAQGADLTTSGVVVTASVSAGGTLIGAATATTVNGIAIFSDLGLNGTLDADYTLTFSSSNTSAVTKTVKNREYVIGDTGPGGGKIFYVSTVGFTCGESLSQTCNYLESAPTGNGLATDWVEFQSVWAAVTIQSLNFVEPYMGAQAIGGGRVNSNMWGFFYSENPLINPSTPIESYRGPNNLSDWYLPTAKELEQLWQRRSIVGGFGGFYYWSSSWQSGTNKAYYLDSAFGSIATMPMNGASNIAAFRPIRSF